MPEMISTASPEPDNTVFRLVNLTVQVPRRTLFRAPRSPTIIDRVNLNVIEGTTMGIQGPSGAGKSTLARAASGLIPSAAGSVLLDGLDLLAMSSPELRRTRQRIQLVLQNTSSLSPYHRVSDILTEPLRNFGVEPGEWEQRVDEILESMSLPRIVAGRYPSELSGGQQQRVSIARALIVDPAVVIFDEPVSFLDRVVQLSVLDDLKQRQSERGLTYVIITHDPNVAAYMCDEIREISAGKIVE